ncbi:MAG: hypothetical protein Kow0031_15540 [Anaerolineae bacterium]
MEPLIGKTLGQYQLVEQIGQGGMATVYKAYQPGLDRYVAVKILPAYFAHEQDFAARFTREAQAIARLDHPHILPVYDFGKHKDISYIVMKYVPAGTLKDRLGSAMAPLETVKIIDQVAAALDSAHQQGVLHRDVKPGNMLIDDKDWVFLSDFGLAKMTEGSVKLTGTGVGVGTPAYMSPEQGKGLAVDARTDVYALGVIVFEMLTGRVPFEAETPMAVVIKHVTDPIPLPRQINPNIPEPVERVLLKSLAKDRDHRYGSAGALAAALRKAVQELDPKVASMPIPPDPDATRLHAPPPVPVEPSAAPLQAAGGAASSAAPLPGQHQPEKRSLNGLLVMAAGLAVVLALALLALGGWVLFGGQSGVEPAEPNPQASDSAGGVEVASDTSATPTATPLPAETATPEPVATPTSEPPATPTAVPSPRAENVTQDTIALATSAPSPTPETLTMAAEPPPGENQVIDSFEGITGEQLNSFEINRNAGNEASLALAGSAHANQSQQALAFEFDIGHDRPDHYIGVDRAFPAQDWSGFEQLCVWVEGDGSNRSLVLQFGESKFKFWKETFSLAGHGQGDYCIPLRADHQLDLRAIGYYGIYVEGPPQGQSVIYLDDVRIVGAAPAPPTATPTATLTPAPRWADTGLRPEGRISDIWGALNAGSGELGFPLTQREGERLCARQRFERGFMLWFDRPGESDVVWGAAVSSPAATSGSPSFRFADQWPGSPEYWCNEASARAPLGPKRGFGMLWCIYPELRNSIGNAIEEEIGGEALPRCEAQLFQGGAIVHQPMDGAWWVFIDSAGWYRFGE